MAGASLGLRAPAAGTDRRGEVRGVRYGCWGWGHPARPAGVCGAGRAAGREGTGSPGAALALSRRAWKGKVFVKCIYLTACHIKCFGSLLVRT